MAENTDKQTLVHVEALLKNGREVFLTLTLPRDSVTEVEGVLHYRIEERKGVVEEHMLPRAELAYLHLTTQAAAVDPTGMRTLGRQTAVEVPEPVAG